MKIVIQMAGGAIVGFLIMYFALSSDRLVDFTEISFPASLALFIVTGLLIAFTIVSLIQMKQKASMSLNGAAEDERDSWQYKRFSDTTLVANAAFVLSIVNIAVVIITKLPDGMIIGAGVALAVSGGLSLLVPGMVNTFYPERDLPSVSEKNYTKKLLAASDEGERHVMLEGLYRTFSTMNLTLVIALLLFLFYSVYTGVSQLFAIVVIGGILIAANAQYLLLIRNR